MANPKKAPKQDRGRSSKKKKPTITAGVVHVNATFNNTKICVTDAAGNVLARNSAGQQGFKGSRKSTPYAAQVAAKEAMENVVSMHSMKEIAVIIKGAGPGREAAVKTAGEVCRVTSIQDQTPIPHNGCRAEKERRV